MPGTATVEAPAVAKVTITHILHAHLNVRLLACPASSPREGLQAPCQDAANSSHTQEADKPHTAAAAPKPASSPAFAGIIDSFIAETSTSVLKPYSFFVSWQGVITLAYRCAARQAAKQQLHSIRGAAGGLATHSWSSHHGQAGDNMHPSILACIHHQTRTDAEPTPRVTHCTLHSSCYP